MNNLKKLWEALGVAAAAVIGFLLYYLNLKNKQAAALQAQVDNVSTQKQADVLESQIQDKLNNANMLQKEVDDHQKALDQLAGKRKQMEAAQQDTTPQQNVDYWNKQ